MKINRFTLDFMHKLRLKSLTLRETSTPVLTATTAQLDDDFLQAKNVIISGEFFPTSKGLFIDKLLSRNVNVQPQLTPETDILICGKYPDWVLVEEAKIYGLKIIFVDKAGELFSRMATKLNRNRAVLAYEEPLGV